MIRQPYRRGELIHGLFEECAGRRPEATALVQGDDAVSYGVLDAVAGDLAARLQARGVAPGDIVAVIMPRSIRLVVALLGVLKCGAGYAALDPRWPREHLADLIATMDSPVVATDDPALAAGRPVIAPEEVARFAEIAERPRVPAPVAVTGDDIASVFFTSGTTGRPKGALSPHRATVRVFQDCTFAEFGEGTVMPLASAVSWDVFSGDLWSVLMNGGCSVVIEEDFLLPARLREVVARHGVDTLFLTATLFNMFVDEDLDAFAGMRQVITGGEKASPRHFARFLERHPDTALINGYGPVESTYCVTAHRVEPSDCTLEDGIPLGLPVPNTGLHVWNWDERRTCAPGEVGELLISGDGLVTGYLGDERLTAERFPTMTIDGRSVRVYRTGDLVHLSPRGLLHFDGRGDRQVKIRGHRVEPAGIESAAAEIPGVAWCRAVPVPDGAGGYREICLVYTSPPDTVVEEGQVLAALRAGLPRHLVPGRAMRLTTLPMNDNGKLDMAAVLRLVAPERSPAAPGAAPSPAPAEPSPGAPDGRPVAGDDVRAKVAGVFAAVLGVPGVADDADFFALGGTSLDLGVVCTRLAAALGRPVPISEAVRRTTVHALAAWLADGPDQDEPAEEGPGRDAPEGEERDDTARSGAAGGATPLSPMQQSFWLRQALDPDDVSGLCPLAWRIEGPLDEAALVAALRDVGDRQEALRATYQAREDAGRMRPMAVPHPRGDAGVEVERVPGARTESAAWEALRDVLYRPIDIAAGPVWRAAVVPVEGSATTLLGVVVHHVAFDGGSEAVLVGDLATAYAARARGEEPDFGRPAPTLRQVADLLRRRARRVDLDAQRGYWQRALQGIPDLDFGPVGPADAAADAAGEATGGATDEAAARGYRALGERGRSRTVRLDLGPDDAARVAGLAARHATTPFVVFLSAYTAAIGLVTGQTDFGIGVVVSRRAGAALDTVIGCFVDTVCLRMRPRLDEGWDPLVTGVRRTALDGLAAQDVPFAEVVELVNPARTGRDPLYQVLFAYQDNPSPPIRMPGCVAHPVRLPATQGVGEVAIEVWPEPEGTYSICVTYQTESVGERFVAEVQEVFLRILRDGLERARDSRRPGREVQRAAHAD